MTSGCSPKEGGSCDEGAVHCADATTKLFCKGGKFVAMPCTGKGGCTEKDGTLSCRLGASSSGKPCSKSNEGRGNCTDDGKSKVVCAEEKIAVFNCGGLNGCTDKGDGFVCDSSVATVGDACMTQSASCSADKKQMLACTSGSWATSRACRGKKGCRREGDKIMCDQSVGAVGDACSGSACSEDGKQMLSCKNNKLVAGSACRGAEGCHIKGTKVVCDQSKAKEGDACTGGGASCSEDGKVLLKCTDGKFEGVRKCRLKGCRSEGTKILCG